MPKVCTYKSAVIFCCDSLGLQKDVNVRNHVLLKIDRVDIVLLMPWNETAGRREVVPRINELGWINDASEHCRPSAVALAPVISIAPPSAIIVVTMSLTARSAVVK